MGMNTPNQRKNEFKEDSDDPWDIETDEEEEDEIKDDQQLTMLVRKSYVKHLERCLKKNYDDSAEGKDMARIEPSQLSAAISFHAKHLEKKALRTSMRVGIYQRCMVKEIDRIKKATKRNIIHPTFLQRKLRRKELNEKETQTEETARYEEEPPKYHEKTEMQTMLSSAFGFSPGYTEGNEGVDSYEELLNILTSSPHLLETQSKIHQEEESMSYNISSCDITQEVHHSISESAPRRMNLDERLQLLGLLCDEDDGNTAPTMVPPPALQAISTVAPPTLQDLFVGKPDSITKMSRRTLIPSNWFEEYILQTELVNAIMMRKSPFKRALIERRFRDLFGSDGDFVAPSVPECAKVPIAAAEDLLNARRFTAGLVVHALTPFYLQGRIGTRVIFKNLAKRITDRLIDKNMTPDQKDAKKEVKICFALKPEIITSNDIDHVFSMLGSL